MRILVTVILLVISNSFMTYAWYGHLKHRSWPLVTAIVISWLIAFAEYCFQVPANRIGYGELTAYQLKVIQEVITLAVFVFFAWRVLGENMRWNYAVSFVFVLAAVVFAFYRPSTGTAGAPGAEMRAYRDRSEPARRPEQPAR